MYSTERAIAQHVMHQFDLQEQHAWGLLYCKTQHYMCPGIFIAKCLSLVDQWDERYAPPWKFGKQWLAAAKGNGLDGKLVELFMHMTPHSDSNNVTLSFK